MIFLGWTGPYSIGCGLTAIIGGNVHDSRGVTHTLWGEWDFEASKAGPAFGHRGTTIHTLTTLMFSGDHGEGRGLGHLGSSFLGCFSWEAVESPLLRNIGDYDRTDTRGGVSIASNLQHRANGVVEGGAPGLEGKARFE